MGDHRGSSADSREFGTGQAGLGHRPGVAPLLADQHVRDPPHPRPPGAGLPRAVNLAACRPRGDRRRRGRSWRCRPAKRGPRSSACSSCCSAAAVVADPLPTPLPIAARIAAALLAARLIAIAIRDLDSPTAGSRLGWPVEALAAAAAAVDRLRDARPGRTGRRPGRGVRRRVRDRRRWRRRRSSRAATSTGSGSGRSCCSSPACSSGSASAARRPTSSSSSPAGSSPVLGGAVAVIVRGAREATGGLVVVDERRDQAARDAPSRSGDPPGGSAAADAVRRPVTVLPFLAIAFGAAAASLLTRHYPRVSAGDRHRRPRGCGDRGRPHQRRRTRSRSAAA